MYHIIYTWYRMHTCKNLQKGGTSLRSDIFCRYRGGWWDPGMYRVPVRWSFISTGAPFRTTIHDSLILVHMCVTRRVAGGRGTTLVLVLLLPLLVGLHICNVDETSFCPSSIWLLGHPLSYSNCSTKAEKVRVLLVGITTTR